MQDNRVFSGSYMAQIYRRKGKQGKKRTSGFVS